MSRSKQERDRASVISIYLARWESIRLKLVTRVPQGTLVSLRQRRDRALLISIYLAPWESIRLKLVTRAPQGTLVSLRQRRDRACLLILILLLLPSSLFVLSM